MRSDELEVRARLRAHTRSLLAELRMLGVPEHNIRACETLFELHELRDRAYAALMRAPDPDDRLAAG